jgi:D-glycero-alpha-D-manno-heptose-7-phosphate kinase
VVTVGGLFVILTRTPLRISIGGGGTDLPSYYERFGGFVISAAINQYVYIAAHRTFRPNYIIKYSQMETVDQAHQIQHPIIREALLRHAIGPYIELASMADIPAGTGLGSSGSFTVGLLRALYALKREPISAGALAEEACHIEIDLLKEPVGKQDQYVGAYGGLICMEFAKDASVEVKPLRIPPDALHDLEDHLLMFFTGYSRSAGSVLKDQVQRSAVSEEAMLESLHHTKALGLATKRALEAGRTLEYAEIMKQHWARKRARSNGMSNTAIDRWHDIAMENGALGGKLIGAGGGGFLLFYAKDRARLRAAMTHEGLPEVRFDFDHEGSKVLIQD